MLLTLLSQVKNLTRNGPNYSPAAEDKVINRKGWQRQHCKNCWSPQGLQEWGSGYSNTAAPWCSQGCYTNPSQTQPGHIWKQCFAFWKDIIHLLLGYISPLSLGQINIGMNIVIAPWQCRVLPRGLLEPCAVLQDGSHPVCTALPRALGELQLGLAGSWCSKGTHRNGGRTATNPLISSGLPLSYCTWTGIAGTIRSSPHGCALRSSRAPWTAGLLHPPLSNSHNKPGAVLTKQN